MASDFNLSYELHPKLNIISESRAADSGWGVHVLQSLPNLKAWCSQLWNNCIAALIVPVFGVEFGCRVLIRLGC